MKRKSILALLMSALLVGSLLGATGPASAGKKKSGPQVVGEDPSGDWGTTVDPTISPVGDALGMDLTSAAIAMNGKDKVDFIIGVNSLPPAGGMPEVSRYIWDLNVDGKFIELDGKFTNYSRGACDPTAGSCPPPRDPGMQPFFVRGNCTAVEGTNVTTCEELGIVQGVFDAAKATITITVPLELIGAKPGSKINPDVNIFGGSIAAAPSTFLTSGNAPMDTLAITKSFVVMSGKKKK
jgi:hypothetical protein